MILFIGQATRGFLGRECFQELDFRQMFGAARQVGRADRRRRAHPRRSCAARFMSRCRPAGAGGARAARGHARRGGRSAGRGANAHRGASVRAEDIDAARRAARALPSGRSSLVGGGGWDAEAAAQVQAFCRGERRCPVAASFRCQDYVDNRSACYVGRRGRSASTRSSPDGRGRRPDPGARRAARRGDDPRLHAARSPAARADARPRARRPGRARPRLPGGACHRRRPARARGGAGAASAGRRRAVARWAGGGAQGLSRTGSVPAWHAGRRSNSRRSWPGCANALPDDAIIAYGAGNFTVWVHRFFRYRRFRTQLAPARARWATGVPAADRGKARRIPAAPWSASRATAVS